MFITMAFAPWYVDALAEVSSKALNETAISTSSSNHTSPSNFTNDTSLSMTLNEMVIATSSSNNEPLSNVTASNAILSESERQLLEQQFFKIGNTLFDQGNYTGAITYYDKALEINSTDINVLYNKALSLDNLGRLEEAITYYTKVLAIKPNDTDTLSNTGLAYANLGKHEQAITYYDRVLAVNPEDTDALYNKGLSLDALGQKDNATLYYKKVLAINPNDTSALNKLNLTYNNANNSVLTGIQKTDQTILVAVGVFASLAIGILLISLRSRGQRHKFEPQITTKEEPTETEKPKERKPKLKETGEDDGWKGV